MVFCCAVVFFYAWHLCITSYDVPRTHAHAHAQRAQPEYLEAKAKWEATLGKLEELTTHTTELVRAREVIYDQLVATSLSAYASSDEAAASSARCRIFFYFVVNFHTFCCFCCCTFV